MALESRCPQPRGEWEVAPESGCPQPHWMAKWHQNQGVPSSTEERGGTEIQASPAPWGVGCNIGIRVSPAPREGEVTPKSWCPQPYEERKVLLKSGCLQPQRFWGLGGGTKSWWVPSFPVPAGFGEQEGAPKPGVSPALAVLRSRTWHLNQGVPSPRGSSRRCHRSRGVPSPRGSVPVSPAAVPSGRKEPGCGKRWVCSVKCPGPSSQAVFNRSLVKVQFLHIP